MITPAEIRAARILIVDDLRANVLLLEGMLRNAGYTAVSHTMQSRDVYELHRSHRYDLILLDLQMPDLDGFQVMEGLREIEVDAYLPVLVLTAQPAHKLRALKAGARDFVSKPFDLAEVLMRVHNLLEVRLLHQKLAENSKKLELRNQFICETFGRYLSDSIVEGLLASPGAFKIGETRTVTMMMTDIRGYTSISERLSPAETGQLVNNYLEKMIEIIVQYGGTIDEFTGDGLLGLFGAPLAFPDDAQRAVACAVAMQLAMVQVNARNKEMQLPAVEMGIGLNTGDVTVGHIGSFQRAKYGVLGAAVNLTARIESFTTGGQIMISQSTYDVVRDGVDIEERLHVAPKGVNVPIDIYSVVGIKGRPELALSRIADRLMPPTSPLNVRFTIVESKDAAGDILEGRVKRISRHNAEIEASCQIPAFANIRLELMRAGIACADNVYAKVSGAESSDGVVLIRFTSVSPQSESFLETLWSAGDG